MKPTGSFFSRHLWLWGATGTIGGLLAYAAAGNSAAILGGFIAGVTPIWLGASVYKRRSGTASNPQDTTGQGLKLLAPVREIEPIAATGVRSVSSVQPPATAIDPTAPVLAEFVEPRTIAAPWSETPLVGRHEVDEAPSAEISPVELRPGRAGEVASATPRLRLVQPYERPLLPFTSQRASADRGARTPGTGNDEESALEITVDELLVDLEDTLSLIRSLKQTRSSAQEM